MMIDHQLHDVPNDDLIIQLKRLVGSSNELTAQLLAHLAEVDARGLYRSCACATLYAYCVYELRLSEDEAQRRCRAARVARQFPLLFDMLAEGSIHLTGILLLAPHLTQENHDELLARARYRTKREIEKLVADVAPCADAPSLIQPLGRAPDAPGRPASTWAALVRGWAGPVRHLVPGDGPAQAPMGELARQVAHGSANEAPSSHHSMPSSEGTAPARGTIDSSVSDGGQASSTAPARKTSSPSELDDGQPRSAAPVRETVGPRGGDGSSTAPVRETIDHPSAPDGGQPLGVQRYKVQFTADQSYVELLERARDLLQHEVFDRDLARVHRLALEALLEKLSKRKYAGRAAEQPASEQPAAELAPTLTPASATRQPTTTTAPVAVDTFTPGAGGTGERGRYIPANVKRAVWARDGARCTFTDARGQRCRETTLLEFHHREAYAKGGPTSLDNLTLHCRSHNRLAAEMEFGRVFVDKQARRSGRTSCDGQARCDG